MKEVIQDIDRWQETDEGPVAVATVVETWGSAPRKAGAKMAMTAGGQISGSVSGGCVEGAVVEAGTEALSNGRSQLLHFGVADETAWEVGLACGGTIDVFVEPLDGATYAFIRDLVAKDRAGASITVIKGPDALVGRKLTLARDGGQIGTLGDDLDAVVRDFVKTARKSQRVHLGDDVELFVDMFLPAPTLVMVGGVHIAVALTRYAKMLGYRTLVVDPRRAFGSVERFPDVDTLHQLWPQKAFEQIEVTPETAVALLTHDPKIDDPALKVVLDSPAFYIGALGSSRTHAKRVKRLEKMGFTADQIARIHAPIGLDIGAVNPEEIALAVMAEIVKAQRSG